MKRKIIKQGNNTLTITLPKKYTDRLGIKAGDEIELSETGNVLEINSKESSEPKKITVEIPKGTPVYGRYIFMPYSYGYDEIKVIFHDNDAMSKINKYILYMMGFEIVHLGENYCILKNIARGMEESFDTVYTRLMHLTLDMARMVKEELNSNKKEQVNNIKEMEGLANKLNLFCRRMLNINGYKDISRTNSIYRLHCLYEEITDYLRDICEIVDKKDIKIDRRIIDSFDKLIELISIANSLHAKKNIEKASEYAIKEKKLLENVNQNIEDSNKQNILIWSAISKIGECLHNMSEELF
jgi:antitoxin component of MazEF toxin-antitoxin module